MFGEVDGGAKTTIFILKAPLHGAQNQGSADIQRKSTDKSKRTLDEIFTAQKSPKRDFDRRFAMEWGMGKRLPCNRL